MRSILCLTLIAVPAFATGLDAQKLERLLGLGRSEALPPAGAVLPSPLPWRLLGTLRETGDTITRVNGLPLDNLERVFSLLPLLTTAGRFEVEPERDGQRLVESVALER